MMYSNYISIPILLQAAQSMRYAASMSIKCICRPCYASGTPPAPGSRYADNTPSLCISIACFSFCILLATPSFPRLYRSITCTTTYSLGPALAAAPMPGNHFRAPASAAFGLPNPRSRSRMIFSAFLLRR